MAISGLSPNEHSPAKRNFPIDPPAAFAPLLSRLRKFSENTYRSPNCPLCSAGAIEFPVFLASGFFADWAKAPIFSRDPSHTGATDLSLECIHRTRFLLPEMADLHPPWLHLRSARRGELLRLSSSPFYRISPTDLQFTSDAVFLADLFTLLSK